MRDGNLGEADCRRDGRRGILMRDVAIAMHEDDGDRSDAVGEGRGHVLTQARGVQRHEHASVRHDAFPRLDHAVIEHVGQHDVTGKQLRPVLVADAQHIAEALRRDEEGAVALAFEQRVGGDGGAHLHGADPVRGQGIAGLHAEQVADALQRRVGIAAGIFRQDLARSHASVRRPRDDVGEGAAAVDPELPGRLSHPCRISQRAA